LVSPRDVYEKFVGEVSRKWPDVQWEFEDRYEEFEKRGCEVVSSWLLYRKTPNPPPVVLLMAVLRCGDEKARTCLGVARKPRK